MNKDNDNFYYWKSLGVGFLLLGGFVIENHEKIYFIRDDYLFLICGIIFLLASLCLLKYFKNNL